MATSVHVEPLADAAAADAEGFGLTRLHVAAIGLCAMAFAVDLGEFAVGNALSAIFSAGSHPLTPGLLALLVSSTYAGAVIGAACLGRLGDRIGPRRTLVLVLAWLCLATIVTVLSRSPQQLILARFSAGLALGAYPPLMIAYLSDIAPPPRRGMVIFWTCALAYLGPPAMIFTARWLTPLAPLGVDGWRWPVMVAAVLAFAAWLGLQRLPEGPLWLASAGRRDEAALAAARFGRRPPWSEETERPKSAPLGTSGVWPRLTGRLAIYATGYAMIAVATVAFPAITGPALLARGISLSDTLLFVGLASFGPVAGTLAASAVVDRVPQRWSLTACATLMLAAVVGFFALTHPLAVGAAVMAFGVGMALYLPTIAAHGAEIFPLSARVQATSMGWASNRIGAALGPFALLPLARAGRLGLAEAILCASILATMLLVWMGPSENQTRKAPASD